MTDSEGSSLSILDTVAGENPAIVALDKHLRQGRRKSKVPVELVVSEMTNNGSMEMVKETTSYAREFGIGITVSCAGPDSEEYSTRNEASSCLRNVIERNPLGGMRSLGNEGAGPTDIFAFNDLGAINVYRAARQHSISLPEQLSIIGFDDVYPGASMCHP